MPYVPLLLPFLLVYVPFSTDWFSVKLQLIWCITTLIMRSKCCKNCLASSFQIILRQFITHSALTLWHMPIVSWLPLWHSCPSTFSGSTSTISRFGERFRVCQYSFLFAVLLLTVLPPPRVQLIVKSGEGTCPASLAQRKRAWWGSLEYWVLQLNKH